jgi:hypothetical protein
MKVEEVLAGKELDELLDIKLNLLGCLPYSSDMGLAWRVVDAMTERGWHFSMDYYPEEKAWSISFFKNVMTFEDCCLWDVAKLNLALPHYICLAALKVLG